MRTLLAVDVGNTNISFGLFQDETLADTWRIATDARRTRDEYAVVLGSMLQTKGFDSADVTAAVMCSVVPPLTATAAGAILDATGAKPLIVGPGTRTGIKISYDSPQDVGADRIVDALAATALYGGNIIVVDFGTATVFDAISADGEYLGGALTPGLGRAADALYESASQLRRVELRAPVHVIGHNTVEATQSGLVYGFVSLVEGMIERFRNELIRSGTAPDDQLLTVVATGGLAPLIADHTDVFTHVNLDLTLVGLRMAYDMNA